MKRARNTLLNASVMSLVGWLIFSAESLGSDPVQSIEASAVDVNPGWSPDGTMIAFASNSTEVPDIYVMDLDGSHPPNDARHVIRDISLWTGRWIAAVARPLPP